MEDNLLGLRLRKLRKRKNLSQTELADRFGLTKFQISRYEKGDSNPDPDIISKLATFFDVSTDYLLGLTNKEKDIDFDPIAEHNRLLKKYGIEESGFFDIEQWKQLGPEELKQIENHFKFIVEQAKQKNKNDSDN